MTNFNIREKLTECTTGPGTREPDELEYLQIALPALLHEAAKILNENRRAERKPNTTEFVWQGPLSAYKDPGLVAMLLDIEALIFELKQAYIIDQYDES